MFKPCILFAIFAACSSYGSVSAYCPEKDSIHTLLDDAADFVSKAKNEVSACNQWEDYRLQSDIPVDCAEHVRKGSYVSGVYVIQPDTNILGGKAFKVYCDMETDGGGWTVIQRRGNHETPVNYFFKDWKSYKEGFGDIQKEFWLGNEYIYAITNQKIYSARFDLEDIKQNKRHVMLDKFIISGEYSNYTLSLAGVRGNGGDSISYHNGMQFSTKDRDHDLAAGINCAQKYKGAWWYNSCLESNLNGLNYQGVHAKEDEGINWISWTGHHESLTKTEIKLRPQVFSLPDGST